MLSQQVKFAKYSPHLWYGTQQLIFNSDGDVTGSLSINAVLVYYSIFSILVPVFVLSLKKRKLSWRLTRLEMSALYFYLYCLLSAPLSLNPLLSLFWASLGIAVVLWASCLGQSINSILVSSSKPVSQFLPGYLLIFSLFAICINLLKSLIYFKADKVLSAGLSSSFLVIIILFALLIKWMTSNSLASKACIISVAALTTFLNSFSSLVSCYIALAFFSFRRAMYALSAFLVTLGGAMSYFLYKYASENIGSFLAFNKNAEAFLTGSGRIDILNSSLDAFQGLSPLHKLFGVGFMAERQLLVAYDLPWITHVHNSMLSSLLGLGIVGIALCIYFYICPFLSKPHNSVHLSLFLTFHLAMVVFGITDIVYIAKPSIPLLFSLVIYRIFKLDRLHPAKAYWRTT